MKIDLTNFAGVSFSLNTEFVMKISFDANTHMNGDAPSGCSVMNGLQNSEHTMVNPHCAISGSDMTISGFDTVNNGNVLELFLNF